MLEPPVTFDLAAVNAAIAGTEFAGYPLHFPSVTSTMDLALEAARSGARHGVWIADEQTAGRGRGSHTWHSAPGDGLYLTALISPPIPMMSTLRLSFSTAMAVQSAICSVFGFHRREQIDIRWPNDLVVPQPTGASRKIGGILIDTAAKPAPENGLSMLRYAIIGIGVNVNHAAFPPELESIATSIRRELRDPTTVLHRESLTAATLVALDEEIRLLIRGWRGTNNQRDRKISDYSSWISGKRVRVEGRDDDPGYTGTTAGLNSSGFLLVAGDDGQIHTVLSGGLRETDN